MAISPVSFWKTPQAGDDVFYDLLNEDSTADPVFLNVMGNDLGGKAKWLWSLDDGTENEGAANAADLLTQDGVGVSQTSLMGAKISITSTTSTGGVNYQMTDALRASLQGLAAGERVFDSFTYAIRLANGTLSWATVQVELEGRNDGVQLIAIGTDATGAVTEDATTPDLTDQLDRSGWPTAHPHLDPHGGTGVGVVRSWNVHWCTEDRCAIKVFADDLRLEEDRIQDEVLAIWKLVVVRGPDGWRVSGVEVETR